MIKNYIISILYKSCSFGQGGNRGTQRKVESPRGQAGDDLTFPHTTSSSSPEIEHRSHWWEM